MLKSVRNSYENTSISRAGTNETNLRDDPGPRKHAMKRGTKYPEKVMDSSKVAFSVMFASNAEGDVLPPYVVYKSVHVYNQWIEGDPQVQDTTNQRVVGLIKPHSPTDFSN